jgi:hypothetical protein
MSLEVTVKWGAQSFLVNVNEESKNLAVQLQERTGVFARQMKFIYKVGAERWCACGCARVYSILQLQCTCLNWCA